MKCCSIGADSQELYVQSISITLFVCALLLVLYLENNISQNKDGKSRLKYCLSTFGANFTFPDPFFDFIIGEIHNSLSVTDGTMAFE
mmetsp:Transcript_13104/g.14433  ORF Transcript_13104/g.14433 Transcript_13104/m.14433 type:complete len:87 (-) Transcript_13104:634-894(-)